jgi:tetratricopeptide (TPR) repeat protein
MSITLFASLFLSLNFVTVGSNADSTVALQQGRNTIEGRITTADNRPVENARVFLTAEGPLAQTITDGSGRYQFRRLRRGIYYIEVEPGSSGLARQSQRVEINQPDLAGNGGADFYRADFVLKPDRRSDRDEGVRGANGALFYQDVPQAAKDAYKLGSQSLEKNQLREAEAALVKAIQLFPDYYDALESLGSMYVKYAQYDAGLPLLSHAVEINQRGWQAYYGLGVALLESKRRTEGLDALTRARTLNPDSININMRLGLELAKEERSYEDAIKSLTKVTDLAGKRLPDAYLALASIYDKRKQYGEEANALDGFLKAAPDTPQRDAIRTKILQLRQKAKTGK